MAKREMCKGCINNKNGWCIALKTNKIPSNMEYCTQKLIDVPEEVINQNPLEILGINSMVIAMEECAELQQAISNMIRCGDNQENLAEEIADVLTCIDWVIEYFSLERNHIKAWQKIKEQRIKERIAIGELR